MHSFLVHRLCSQSTWHGLDRAVGIITCAVLQLALTSALLYNWKLTVSARSYCAGSHVCT
jgi:hypothetical protein